MLLIGLFAVALIWIINCIFVAAVLENVFSRNMTVIFKSGYSRPSVCHSYCLSGLHLLLPLQELHSLQDGAVVMDAVFSQDPLIVFGIVTSE